MLKLNVVFSYFVLGGPFMYPLLVFFLGTLFFVIERSIVFLLFDWNTLFFPQSGNINKKNIFLSLLEENHKKFNEAGDGELFNTFMELGCREIINVLEKNLNFLTGIATLAPITGFLGTVTGMIIAFRDITNAEDVSPQLVAGGIYEALITTAGGLIITILSSFFYFLYSGKIKNYSKEMEKQVNRFYRDMKTPGKTVS